MRYTTALILTALAFSVVTAKAEDMPKMKMKGKADAAVQKDAECKMSAATNDAACTMEQKKEQMQKMKQKQMQNAEAIKTKGSEQGQSMREEHSRKWWKFWGEKTEE